MEFDGCDRSYRNRSRCNSVPGIPEEPDEGLDGWRDKGVGEKWTYIQLKHSTY